MKKPYPVKHGGGDKVPFVPHPPKHEGGDMSPCPPPKQGPRPGPDYERWELEANNKKWAP